MNKAGCDTVLTSGNTAEPWYPKQHGTWKHGPIKQRATPKNKAKNL